MAPQPYKSTPVFDGDSLPAGLRREHRTKAGVWGVIHVLDGALRLDFDDDGRTELLSPGKPGLVLPEQPHRVAPIGPMLMRVDFYDEAPDLAEMEVER